MLVVANQASGVRDRYRLTDEEARRAAWAIEPDGRRLEGAAALNRVLEELGSGWRLVAAPYRVAPVRALEDAAYRWFAPRRSRFRRFGVDPEVRE